MNFNLILLLFILTSCGVKGDPISPKDGALPSLLENYDDIQTNVPLNDTKPKKR